MRISKLILLVAVFSFFYTSVKCQTVSIDTIDCFVYLRFDTCSDYEFINAYVLYNDKGNFKNLPLYDDLTFNNSLFKKHPKIKKKLFKGNKNGASAYKNADTYSTVFEKLIQSNYFNYSNDTASSCRFLNSNNFYLSENEIDKLHPISFYIVVKSKLILFNYSKVLISDYNQMPIKRPLLVGSSDKWWCADYEKIDRGVSDFTILYKLIVFNSLEKRDREVLNYYGFEKSKCVSIKICSFE